MASPYNEIRLEVSFLFEAIVFPSTPRTAEWWKCPHSLQLNSNGASALNPLCRQCQRSPLLLCSYRYLYKSNCQFLLEIFRYLFVFPNIHDTRTSIFHSSLESQTWTHEKQYYGHCWRQDWWTPGGVNTQVILRTLDHVPRFITCALGSVKLKII